MFYDAYTDSIIDLCPRARKFHIWIQVQSIWIDCSLPKATWIKSMLHLTDLRSILFFFGLRFAFIYTTFGWGKKDGWIGKRNPSRSEELGEEKASVSLSLFNLTFPSPLYFQSLQSLVPIFLPTRKLKEKIAFHYFFPSGF